MNKDAKTPFRVKLIVALATLILSTIFCFTRLPPTLDNLLLDQYFFMRGPLPSPEDVVIIGIDEPSFSELGLQWPWPRALHAELIDSLTDTGAAAIALDIILAEKSDPIQDKLLAESLKKHGRITMASDIQLYKDKNFTQQIIVKPLPVFMVDGVKSAFVNLPVDEDGILRENQLSRKNMPSFALQASQMFCAAIRCNNAEQLDFFSKGDRSDSITINFYGPARTIKTVSYYQALDPDMYLPKDIFKNKLVFIGLSTQSIVDAENKNPDYFPIPFTKIEQGYMAGVEIHAQAAANLLNNNFIRTIPSLPAAIIGLFLCVLFCPLFFYFRPLAGVLLLLLYTVALLSFGYQLLSIKLTFMPVTELIIPVTLCYGLVFLSQYYSNFREKLFIRGAFGRYVSPHVVQQLISSPEKLSLSGSQKILTVLFTDIRGFTTFSEKLDSQELGHFMNEYLSAMSEVILAWDGTVDKFIGDAIMAIWGAPLDDERHAAKAVQCALAMAETLNNLRQEWVDRGYPEINIGIGINTGMMRVGNFGSNQRFDYTVIGDNVNLASRLEGATKNYGVTTIISENTLEVLSGEFCCRYLDKVRVKGKIKPISIYEPICAEPADHKIKVEIARFDEAIDYYLSGNFKEALVIFEELNSSSPCRLYTLYMDRLDEFIVNPPVQDWDGVYTFTTK